MKLKLLFFKLKKIIVDDFRVRTIFLMLFIFLILYFTKHSSNQPNLFQPNPIPFKNSATLDTSDWQKFPNPNYVPPIFTISTPNDISEGIDPLQKFILNSTTPISQTQLESLVQTTSLTKIESISDTEYSIQLTNQLPPESKLQIKLLTNDQNIGGQTITKDYSWVYQTKKQFSIISTLPGNQAIDVPINTGIEIKFNRDNYEDPSNLISITPPIDYKLQRQNNTLLIIPQSLLQPGQVYEVKLKSGLALTPPAENLSKDFSFTFQTKYQDIYSKNNQSRITLNDNFIQVRPSQRPLIKIYTNKVPEDIIATIYKFSSNQQFIDSRILIDQQYSNWYYTPSEKEEINTSSLIAISNIPVSVDSQVDSSGYFTTKFIEIPNKLDTGYYLIQFKYNQDQNLTNLWVQSTDMSAVITVGKRQTLIWTNDLNSNTPINNASVSLNSEPIKYYSNADGIASFPTFNSFFGTRSSYPLVTAPNGESLVLKVNSLDFQKQPDQIEADDYWSYLYHERSKYRTSDTLNLWGVVKPREGIPNPQNLSLKIEKSHSYYYDEPTTIKSQTVRLFNNTYTESINFENLPVGWYYISLYINDVRINSSSFEIENIQKPLMQFKISQDKQAIFYDESVIFKSHLSFYDNTPVPGIELNVTDGKSNTTLKTDKHGYADYNYNNFYISEDSPSNYRLTFSPNLAQQGLIEGFSSIKVFQSRLIIQSKSEVKDNQLFISGSVNQIDLSNLNNQTSNNYIGQSIPNHLVKINITRNWYEKVQEGTYYDFVEKVTYPQYTYNRKSEVFPQIEITTDQSGNFTLEQPAIIDSTYEINISTSDRNNRPAFQRYYQYYFPDYYNSRDTSQDIDMELTQQKQDNHYSINEPVNIIIKNPEPNAKYLFIQEARGNQDFYVSTEPKFDFTYSNNQIPNAYISAIALVNNQYQIVNSSCNYYWYCSSQHYDTSYFLPSVEVKYQSQDSKLDLTILTDQTKYSPSQTAKIQVQVSKDNVILPSAEVNIALIDKSLVAIGGANEPNPLNSIYKTIPNKLYYIYHTHLRPKLDTGAAEMGGGGEGDIRKLFKDTAYFKTSKTDNSGIASFEIPLPDNLTTWIIYVQAVNDSLHTGHNSSSIIVTKDFFVTSTLPNQVILGDKPNVSLNSFGTQLIAEQPVEYSIKFNKNNSIIGQKIIQGLSSQDTFTPFPSESIGDYEVITSAKYNNYQDAIANYTKIVPPRFSLRSSQSQILGPNQELNFNYQDIQSNSISQLTILDEGRSKYFWKILSLCLPNSNRVEKRISSIKANQILKDFYDSNYCSIPNMSDFQATDGGINQVKWGSSDLFTTVWAIYQGLSNVDSSKLIEYLNGQNSPNQTLKNKILLYWGLSLLGENHITTLKNLAQQSNSFEEHIYSALALNSVQDYESSQQIYDLILNNYVYKKQDQMRIQHLPTLTTDDLTSITQNTAIMLILDQTLNNQYSIYLYNYLQNNPVYDATPISDSSTLYYFDSILKTLPVEPTKINISTSQFNKQLNLQSCCSNNTFNLDTSDLSSLKINVQSGQATAILLSSLTPEASKQLSSSNKIALSRTYQNLNDHKVLQIGDIIKIILTPSSQQPLFGTYMITDILPSGLTFIDNPTQYGLDSYNWSLEHKDQVVTLKTHNSQYYGFTPQTYYARVTSTGTYIKEPATIQYDNDLSIFAITDQEEITIPIQ